MTKPVDARSTGDAGFGIRGFGNNADREGNWVLATCMGVSGVSV